MNAHRMTVEEYMVGWVEFLLWQSTTDVKQHVQLFFLYPDIRKRLMYRSWNLQAQEEGRRKTAQVVATLIARMERAAL
jgi:hypothetical protein